jgi:hypothetical protein
MSIIKFALLCGMAGVAYSLVTIYWVLKKDTGTDRCGKLMPRCWKGETPS